MRGIDPWVQGAFVSFYMSLSLHQASLDQVQELLSTVASRDQTQVEARAQSQQQVEQQRIQEEQSKAKEGLDKAIEDVQGLIEDVVQKRTDEEADLARSEEETEALKAIVATEEVTKNYAAKEQELRAEQEAEKKDLTEVLGDGRKSLENRDEDLPREVRDEHMKKYDDMAKGELDRQAAEHSAEIETLRAERKQEVDRVQTQQPAPPPPPPPEPDRSQF